MRVILAAVILCLVVEKRAPQELPESSSSLAKITGFVLRKVAISLTNLSSVWHFQVLTAFSPLSVANCRRPLGLESGDIKNEQITASSAFENDFATFGSHRARLKLSSWPPGYRGDPNQSSGWIKIDLGKKMVITALATQGYGDPAFPEWIEQYMVMYSNGGDFLYFQDLEGSLKVSEVSPIRIFIHCHSTHNYNRV